MLATVFPLLVRAALACGAADEFDEYTNAVLSKVPTSDSARAVDRITLTELSKHGQVLSDATAALVVVRTSEGNWAKLLVTRAIRKQGDTELPIVVLQRFFTVRPDGNSGRLAAGRGVYLFDGFHFDLDIGQVVPDGGGDDIVFRREGETGGFIEPVGNAKLYLVTKSLVPKADDAASGPTRGPVVPPDFAGKYRLVANGQWSGKLTLEVTKSGDVTGSYVSDQSGRDYPVKGFVATPANHIKFTIELPQAKQEFDGYLWTQGKSAIAGVTTLTERPFGFVAVRDGAELLPKDE